MQKSLFENFIGKQVELFMAPDMPVASGILVSCDDDFIVIGDEVWSYKAILGVRPVKTPKMPSQTDSEPKTVEREEDEVPQPFVKKKEHKAETVVKPQPETSEKSEASDSSASPSVPAQSEEGKKEKEEETKKKADDKPRQPEIVIPDREFTGVLTTYYENRHWGFIESDDVKKAGIPLRDGNRVFVHVNQITDAALRKKLLTEKPATPNIDVVFRLIKNQQGVAADDVKETVHIKLADLIAPIKAEDEKKEETQAAKEGEATETKATETVEKFEPHEEVGEIDYYRRYENPPYGKIRIKGNKLFHFEDIDVIDPVLAVFLEVSPSAEGQAVKFIANVNPKGRMRATKVEAAEPFPEEKLESWKDLIEKAKKRMQQEA